MKWFIVISFMGVGASSFLGVQSPASGVEEQIAYYKQAVCGAFCFVSPWKSISNFIFDLISQFLEEYSLTSFLLPLQIRYEKIAWSCSNSRLAWEVPFCLLSPPLLCSHKVGVFLPQHKRNATVKDRFGGTLGRGAGNWSQCTDFIMSVFKL